MRKKPLIILTIILAATTVLSLGAITYAMPSAAIDENNIAQVEMLTEDYLKITSPTMIAGNSEYIVAASQTHAAILDGNGECVKITDHTISKIAVLDKYLFVLISDDNENKSLCSYDLSDNFAEMEDFNNILRSTENDDKPKDITVSDGYLYIATGRSFLYRTNISEGALTDLEKVDVAIDMIFDSITRISKDKIYSYDFNKRTLFVGDKKTPILEQIDVNDFIVSDSNIFTLYKPIEGKEDYCKISAYSPDGKLIKEYSAAALSGIAFSQSLYTCLPQENRVISLNEQMAVTKIYGDKGNGKDTETGRFDTPQDISVYGDYAYIADTENSRVAIYNTKSGKYSSLFLAGKPKLVSGAKDGIFVYFPSTTASEGGKIIKYTLTNGNYAESWSYNTPYEIIDIESWQGGLIALNAAGNIYLIKDGEGTLIASDIRDAKYLHVSEGSNILYALSQDLIYRYNMLNSSMQNTQLTRRAAEGISVDFSGNAYLYYGDSVDVYMRTSETLNYNRTISLSVNIGGFKGEISADTGDIYLADKDGHSLRLLSSAYTGAVANGGDSYQHPDKSKWDLIRAGILTSDSTVYAAPNNTETINSLKKGTVFLCLTEHIYEGTTYYYGTTDSDDLFYYIEKSDANIVLADIQEYPSTHKKMNALTQAGADIYSFPFRSEPSEIIDHVGYDIHLQLINNIGEKEGAHIWEWYKVSYAKEGKMYSGYVKAADVYYVKTPPKGKEYYIVKSDQIGHNVYMYSAPSLDADIIFNDVPDGENVLIIGDYNENSLFTKVLCRGVEGYILTANLQRSGLTANQITAIAVSSVCIVLLIAVGVLLVIRRKAKLNAQSEAESKKQ